MSLSPKALTLHKEIQTLLTQTPEKMLISSHSSCIDRAPGLDLCGHCLQYSERHSVIQRLWNQVYQFHNNHLPLSWDFIHCGNWKPGRQSYLAKLEMLVCVWRRTIASSTHVISPPFLHQLFIFYLMRNCMEFCTEWTVMTSFHRYTLTNIVMKADRMLMLIGRDIEYGSPSHDAAL